MTCSYSYSKTLLRDVNHILIKLLRKERRKNCNINVYDNVDDSRKHMLSERSQSFREAKDRASSQVLIVLPAGCSLSIRDYFYHKQICLVKYVTCQLLLGYQGNIAKKVTKGQILMWKMKRYCYLFNLRHILNSIY